MTLSENLQDVEEDILYKLGGQENIPLVIENGKGWKADLSDLVSNYCKRSIVDVVAGDTYILSFRTAAATNKSCWADDNMNVIGSPMDGGQNMRKVAPAGATKLYISTNTTGTPNAMKVVHVLDSQYVKVYDPAEYLLLDDNMSNASVWKKDQYYPGNSVFSVADNILTIGSNSSGRKFVQRTLQVSDKYDTNAWYRFSFTLRRTTSTYMNRIQIGTCYASTAGTNHDYYDMVMPTTSFKTYSFIGKIYATFGMIKIGAETAFDTIEVSEVLVEKLTDEEYKSLDYLNPLGITYGQSLQKIIDKYPRVHLPAGTTELSYPLEIPNGHTIVGAVGGTTLKLVEGTTCILLSNKINVTISNISFVGEAAVTPADVSPADIKSRTGEGTTSGICLQTTVNRNIVIDNCKFANFSKAGIYSHNPFNYSYSQFLRVTNCCAMNCWCGITFDERAEYNIVSDCAFIYCQYGALVIGGNNKFSNCAFEANGVGFVVNGTTDGSTTAANNSHGIIGNSSFNHCISYGVFAFNAESGFTFTGCHTYGNTSTASKGGIYISNSRGVNYNGGVIGCQIDIDATMSGLNMICNSLFDGGHYNSGTINGDKSKLSMHGNRDMRGIIDKATINNDL